MTVVTPAMFRSLDGVYLGRHLGLPFRYLVAEGIVGATSLAVSERGAGANLSVDVAAGVAWIKGDDSTLQPVYPFLNDATVNLAIAAADATNPRIDRVIAEMRDAAFSGVSTDDRLRVITGTPAGSPSAPALPNNAISLATVSVPALDTTISNAQITNTRPLAGVGVDLVPTVTALPVAPYDGQVVDYLADATNGSVWRLKYRSASASAYKWECIGGTPLRAQNTDTTLSTTSTSYTDFDTAGPSITVPLAGEYRVLFDMQCQNTVGAALVHMAVKIGGAATSDANGIRKQSASANHDGAGPTGSILVTAAASDVLKAQYKVSSGTGTVNNGGMSHPWMTALPVRVG